MCNADTLKALPEILFRNACPNCGGNIDARRLFLGIPCELCLPLSTEEIKQAKENMDFYTFLEFIASNTRLREGSKFKRYIDLELEVRNLDKLSEAICGNKLHPIQRTWAKRLLKGLSFSITAATGLGKTYFGIVAAIYYAMKGKKTLFIVPTAALVMQVLDKFHQALASIGNRNITVIGYHARLSASEKEKFVSSVKEGAFDIIVITSKFLISYFKLLEGHKFDLIFVDDVDALLKSSKNIDNVLYLAGFRKEHIDEALNLVMRKQNFARLRTKSRRKLLEATRKFKELIAEYKSKNGVGQIIVSSATGTTRGLRVKILRELLDFTIGSTRGGFRNIVDSFYVIKPGEKNVIANIIQKLGTGGVIFLSRVNRKIISKVVNDLEKLGFKVGDATKQVNIDKMIKAFSNGELDILIGAAAYYGKLVRGLDIPQAIRYAVFIGVPHFRFPLEITEKTHPYRGYVILSELVGLIEDRKKQTELLRLVSSFRRKFMRLRHATRQQILDSILEKKPLPSKQLEAIKELCINILKVAKELLSDKDIISKLNKSPFVEVREDNGRLYLYIPDAKTYVQCSGRTSRLYAGGITKGLAVIVTRRRKLLESLQYRTRPYAITEWYDFEKLDIDSILEDINKDREKLKEIISGSRVPEPKELMHSALVVVESPTKAKTIASFFGKPAKRIMKNLIVYEASTGKHVLNIMATRGHIFDLVLEDIEVSDIAAIKSFFDISSNLYGVRIESDGDKINYVPEYHVLGICRNCGKRFTGLYERCPRCGSDDIVSQQDVLEVLYEIASESDEVIIATDPDSEGEKIGFDVALMVAPYSEKISRIEYHAITPYEFKKALENPRSINLDMVKAQLVRRITDRWVGFVFSHLLWKLKRVRKKFFSYSAGRVQTPVLGWIIERFDEYKKSKVKGYTIRLSNGYSINIEGDIIPKEVLSSLIGKSIEVNISSTREETINPPPPYTTAELLKDLSNQLKMGSSEIMRILQELFESGLITYHRTDSTRVSPEGINVAKEYIKSELGDLNLFQPRTWGDEKEGAHECIRPTMPITASALIRMLQTEEIVLPVKFTKKHFAVYQQIFKRFMASQMKPARVRISTIDLMIDGAIKHRLEGITDILEPGFMTIYPYNTLPRFEGVEIEQVKSVKIIKKPLYSESDVIDRMRSEGIGRPSTYAIVLDTLFKRGYIKASLYRRKIFPLKKGISIYRLLVNSINSYVKDLKKKNVKLAEGLKRFISVDGTRDLEKKMDLVEQGKEDYQKILREVHDSLAGLLNDLSKYYARELLPAIEKELAQANKGSDRTRKA
ncbi:MAG: reverse gyrase [Candidatus Korarchaeota archaeon]|nr:reverse gyrase [Thermoproteota archaeon]